MSEENKTNVAVAEEKEELAFGAKLDRIYCSNAERIVYTVKRSVSGMSLGNFSMGSDIYLYQIFGLKPLALAKARAGLTLFDMLNDPLSAVIVDRMRTRWGKFKPFQFGTIIPSTMLGMFNCFMPLIAIMFGMNAHEKLIMYMASAYLGETIGALFSGAGFIDLVFTPNPQERTSLNTASEFLADIYGKIPSQIATVIFDLVDHGVIKMDLIKVYVIMNTAVWAITTIPSFIWAFISKERVPQSIQPPKASSSILSVFKNKPLLIHTLSGAIDNIQIGTAESLYFRNVLGLNSFGTVWGIPGGPISYYSYILAPKFRKRFSTKTLWLLQRGSIIVSEGAFFLVGLSGGMKYKLYAKVGVMGVMFMLGNCLEMVFYATKKIVGTEISYEVQDYCEWKNGFRVEATTGLLTNYWGKVQGYLLNLINAWILEKWTGFESGALAVQSEKTKFRLFIMAYGPRLIPDILCTIPMFFYNIDTKTRERMYLELQEIRMKKAAEVAELADSESEQVSE